MRAVAQAVGPLSGHRLVEALDLAVRSRITGGRAQVANASLGEQRGEGAAVRIAPGVVGHQSAAADTELLEVREGALEEGDDGLRAFVGQQLDIGVAGVIVDDRVRVVVTDAGTALDAAAVALARDGVTGGEEARIASDVHVQQVARAGPLVAAGRFAPSARAGSQAVAAQHLRDRRVRVREFERQQPRPPAGAAPSGADPPLLADREQPWHPARAARPVIEADACAPLLGARLAPAPRPATGRRRRDAEGGRGRPQRASLFDRTHERVATGQSELRVTVNLHPGPSSRSESWQTHSLEGGPDVPSAVHNLCGRVNSPRSPYTVGVTTTDYEAVPAVARDDRAEHL